MFYKARCAASYTAVGALALLVGCGSTEDASTPAVSEAASSRCGRPDEGGRVTVCHETGHGRYTLLRVSRQACLAGHGNHDGDRPAEHGRCEDDHDDDDDDDHGACVAVGLPVSGTAQCCAGLVARNGVCVDLCAGVVCSALNACHVAGVCDPATGACSNPAATNGVACDDGNRCTQSDTCQSGVCTGANPVVCSAADACHVAGVCNPASGACSNPAVPDGTLCSLPDANAACTGGVCGVASCPSNRGDCDGVSANGCETVVGAACSAGVGACMRSGVTVCAAGGGARCGATAGAPAVEVCDGADNDCNGVSDDIASASCAPGPCSTGHTACSGTSVVCARDAYVAAGAVCRAAAGVCDAAETCTGASDACPGDQPQASGTACVDGAVSGTCVAFACAPPITTRAIMARGDHSCSVKSDGTVWCSGNNPGGLLGVSMSSPVLTQTRVPSISTADQIAGVLYGVSNCVRLQDRTARCWGSNASGELGDGTTVDSATPVAPLGLSDVAQLSGGVGHFCAVRGDGAVLCWGDNSNGQLGDGTTISRRVPTLVPGLSRIVMVACGQGYTFALDQDGTVYEVNAYAPAPYPDLSNAAEISTAGGEICARLRDGTVRCLGPNSMGQLGDGTTSSRSTSVTVLGLSSVTQISVGGQHACALRSDGTVVCWGSNSDGQLGIGTDDDFRTVASPVLLPLPATQISAGALHTCARTTDGHAYCWGRNTTGQLGNGTTDTGWSPVLVTGS